MCEKTLLKALQSEVEPFVRRRLCDAISELARFLSSHGGTWQELLQVIFECSKSPLQHHRESAFIIIASVPEIIQPQPIQAVKQVLATAIHDEQLKVKVSAIRATCNYLISSSNPSPCADLIPQMLEVLAPLIGGNSTDATDVLGYLIELAEYHAKLFRAVISQLSTFVADILKNNQVDSSVRHSALELLLTIMEIAPGTVKKNSLAASLLVPILMEWMATVEDDADW
jgi:hypothetical protein